MIFILRRPSLFVLRLRRAGAQKCTQKSSPRSSSPRCFVGSTPRNLSECVSTDSLSRLTPQSTGRTYVVSGWGTGHFGANARTVDRTLVRAEPRKGPFPHPELRTIDPRYARPKCRFRHFIGILRFARNYPLQYLWAKQNYLALAKTGAPFSRAERGF